MAGDGLFFEKRLLKRNTRVVFDFDDAIYLGPNEPAVRWMCKNAAWVTPGNEYLGKYARQHTDRVTVIPTVIDTDLFLPQITRPHEEKLVRVGWSGSDQSIQATLFPFLPILMEVQRSTPFELVIVTNTRPQLPVGTDFLWRFVPWSPQLEPHFGTYMDIGIMPLLDQPFQRGKCGFKLLQYMAAALPTIASPVGVNRQITENGCTGFFAETERDWREALDRLLTSFELRRDMGRSGRRRCVQLYSLATWLPRLTAIFEAVANGSGLKSADRLLTSTY
ncbi:MAG TPA: glycosyltransferase family 4 protein [Bryobacteraceae bacterium]